MTNRSKNIRKHRLTYLRFKPPHHHHFSTCHYSEV